MKFSSLYNIDDKGISEIEDRLEKLNPAQGQIADAEGTSIPSTKIGITFNTAYQNLEVVRRGVDLIVDAASEIDYDVGDKLPFTGNASLKVRKIQQLLNHRPNPFEDINSFRRNIVMDLIIEGNAFLYFDGEHLFLLPACRVVIITDRKVYIAGYEYDGLQNFSADEVIHIKDNSADSIYRGDSRLKSAKISISILDSMLGYQDTFFDNGAVPGLVIETKDVLSNKIKDRLVAYWVQRYNPKSGGKRPLILDNGMKLSPVNAGSFKELDFSQGIKDHEHKILKALGVPPILLDSGNNANISPNMKLFYNTTILGITHKIVSALERFFSYDIKEDTSNVLALRPELKDEAAYYASLVNNGIMTGAEARENLRLELLNDPLLDKIRIPTNVAGSASGVTGQEGGKPTNDDGDD